MKRNIAAIILAAGKGTRMKSKTVNKVAMPLANKPMILHTIELLDKLKIKDIVVVVGFAKESVVNLLGQKVSFAEQKKRLGTAHAVGIALKNVNQDSQDVLVLNGDDSAFYTKEVIDSLVKKHQETDSAFTFLTIEKENPEGLGRVVRDKKGNLLAIVEQKDATEEQLKIKEVNPACYIFKKSFLNTYLRKVSKSPVTNEYYLTSLIDLGIKNGEKIETMFVGKLIWRGVNTTDELLEAESLLGKV